MLNIKVKTHMKQLVIAAVLLMASFFSGCSNLPDEIELQTLIKTYEESNQTKSSSFLATPYLFVSTNRSVKIPKLYRFAIGSDPSMDAWQQSEKKTLEALSIKGLISMQSIEEKNFYLGSKFIQIKNYTITLTELGKNILIGETGDEYLLSLSNLNDIKIQDIKKISEDSLQINYSVSPTTAFEVLHSFCTSSKLDSNFVKLFKSGEEWSIVNKK